MGRTARRRARQTRIAARSSALLALALLAPLAMLAGSAAAQAAHVPGAAAAQNASDSALQRRVALLSAELALDEAQQARVEALLQRQREEVRALWNGAAEPAALRIGRMQAISERTAEAIRGVLDTEQRRKYIQPRRREAPVGAGGAGVEIWMAPGGTR